MNLFKQGDLVFAKVRGHTSWPAVISSIEKKGNALVHTVNFFGSDQIGFCKASEMVLYKDGKELYSDKIKKNEKLKLALQEAEKESKKKIPKINRSLNEKLSCTSQSMKCSTPLNNKTDKLEANASQEKSQVSFADKSTHTTVDLDSKVELDVFYENSHSVVTENKGGDFHNQILIDELKATKLEVQSLKEVIEVLQKDKCELEKIIAEKQSHPACLLCYPPANFEEVTKLNPEDKKCKKNLPKNVSRSRKEVSTFQISCQNSFEVLSENENESSLCVTEPPNQKLTLKNSKNKVTKTHKKIALKHRKILLCTDSHGRDLAWHINNNEHKLNDLEAVGFVHPGGRTNAILSQHNIDGEQLGDDDFLVVACGTNDVAVNEAQQALDSIVETLDKFSELNIILVDLPLRHDLAEWSCVNKETVKTNLALKEISRKYKNVTLVEASKATRQSHTGHGLHLNRKGKKWLAEKICKATMEKSPEEPKQVCDKDSGVDYTEGKTSADVSTQPDGSSTTMGSQLTKLVSNSEVEDVQEKAEEFNASPEVFSSFSENLGSTPIDNLP